MSTFGLRLKQLREERRWSQKDLGKAVGVSNVSISGYESGNRFPDTETLTRIADVLEVSTDYLLGRDVPKWASEEDVIELQTLVEENVNMAYGGESLTEEEKQRVKDILTTLFWDKLQKKKEGGKRE